jgi:subtilisin family serine protease
MKTREKDVMNKISMILSTAVVFTAILYATQIPVSRIIPNDPFFKYQVSFLNPGGQITIEKTSTRTSPFTLAAIDPGITRAWTISTGSRKVVVALLDDGFFYNHEDLAGNIWANPGESGPDVSSRSRKMLSSTSWDGQGFWLAQKRLSKGRFRWWPTGRDTWEVAKTLEAHQLQVLLAAGDPTATQAAPLWRRVCAS